MINSFDDCSREDLIQMLANAQLCMMAIMKNMETSNLHFEMGSLMELLKELSEAGFSLHGGQKKMDGKDYLFFELVRYN